MNTSATYYNEFWNSMKKRGAYSETLREGLNSENGSHFIPSESVSKYNDALAKENLFRRIGTVKSVTTGYSTIWLKPNIANIDWIGENDPIPNIETCPQSLSIKSHKLVGMFSVKSDFIADGKVDIEEYLISEFAKDFGKAEEIALINGDGNKKPVGILNSTDGAEIGVTSATNNITFDEITQLFFSVKPEYRTKGVWLMNDETALYLRSLKDDTGNYLWRDSTDTLLGKPVFISNNMPSAESGTKPIAFGDFSYYWLIQRQTLSVKLLAEMYAINDELGYLGFERLDGKLIRPEAIKVLQIAENV